MPSNGVARALNLCTWGHNICLQFRDASQATQAVIVQSWCSLTISKKKTICCSWKHPKPSHTGLPGYKLAHIPPPPHALSTKTPTTFKIDFAHICDTYQNLVGPYHICEQPGLRSTFALERMLLLYTKYGCKWRLRPKFWPLVSACAFKGVFLRKCDTQ